MQKSENTNNTIAFAYIAIIYITKSRENWDDFRGLETMEFAW